MEKTSVTALWSTVLKEAETVAKREKYVAGMLKTEVLGAKSLADFLSGFLAGKLEAMPLKSSRIKQIMAETYSAFPGILEDCVLDLKATRDRDPACKTFLSALLFYKGFHAVQGYRIANRLWNEKQTLTAAFFQNALSERLAVDIHPAARIGSGVFIDHGTGLVIGETAVVGDTVSILHEVTLGGTGKQSGDRHPKVKTGVMIGAGAKILGNVVIGEYAKVGAGSVVLKDVPAHSVVAGVPARVVKMTTGHVPAKEMNQSLKNGS